MCLCVSVCVYVGVYSKAELETCCNVLNKLLAAVDAEVLLSNFHNELLIGLDSQEDTVQQLCLVQVPSLCRLCLSGLEHSPT